ncbi:CRTAC1 family protein [candidate division KSB1 bacterium]|nr:CRTAC1 family protein [candidate division KSB1 bacterium]NIT71235.1 CRTAC1 family protein [candidate division KSB1 bacterium]NIX70915.1 hypothetical protein [candidate division KSB1 bacterium]
MKRLGLPISLLLFVGCVDCNKEVNSNIFIEVSEQVKLDFQHDPGADGSYFMPESIGSGCAFLDYDNDGDLDIYLVNGARHSGNNASQSPLRNRLFRQEPNGTFSDVTEVSGLGDPGYGMGVAVGDIDNDGNIDVYITNYGLDVLYRNNGNGTFTNITKEAGINNPHWGCSAVFFDYNLDGYLDLFVTNYVDYDPAERCMDRSGRPDYCGPGGFPGVADILYHNNGDGTFSDVSTKSGIAKGVSKGLGVVSADFNNDLFPDLYVSNDGEANQLWINQQDGTFQDLALLLGAALNAAGHAEAGMGIALGDMDSDNDLDLFITHVGSESNTLYRSEGDYGFQDESGAMGLAGPSLPYTGFGTGFFDLDHDGDLDLAVANGRISRGTLLKTNNIGYWDYYAEPNFLFENDGEGRFHLLDKNSSPFASLIENSRGLAFGDVDNDGDIDLLLANSGDPARLFRNDLEKKGNWLIVRVFDSDLCRDAVGARVTLQVSGRRLSRFISPGYSFLSSNDHRAHFGLGMDTSIDRVEIQWPDGSTETFAGVRANQIITLKKGQGSKSRSLQTAKYGNS